LEWIVRSPLSGGVDLDVPKSRKSRLPVILNTVTGGSVQIPAAFWAKPFAPFSAKGLIWDFKENLFTCDFRKMEFSAFEKGGFHVLFRQLDLLFEAPFLNGVKGDLEGGQNRILKLLQTPHATESEPGLNLPSNQISLPYSFDPRLTGERGFKLKIDGGKCTDIGPQGIPGFFPCQVQSFFRNFVQFD
jgi:hypothetical protein